MVCNTWWFRFTVGVQWLGDKQKFKEFSKENVDLKGLYWQNTLGNFTFIMWEQVTYRHRFHEVTDPIT